MFNVLVEGPVQKTVLTVNLRNEFVVAILCPNNEKR